MAKPKGHRGTWFAEWGGEQIPCVHQVYFVVRKGKRPIYVDDAVGGNPKWPPFIEAIRKLKKVLLTSDHLENGVPTDRKDYLSLWRVENVRYEHPVLSFEFAERLPPARFS
ncbi:hypothetical protein G4G27_07015 [Sphingomonas sp. So64.6b]|uniref:hypothetical protein n=1 Tax=Sphingomonas sp. So64.6b TaxID=2997354 RepID=UPI0016036CEC|nr:hypothetical protein [Sphingomonas sp. So64.6b]QNA83766.1 hypothetical protein G4G27_07015 [Sphingomonas sp. So64.6b]